MENNLWNYSVFWKETLNQIKESLSEQEWFMWFTNIEYNCSKESEIILNVPSSFYRDQVKQRYLPLIEEKLFSISGHKVKISFLIKDNNSQNKDKSSAANTKTVLSASSPKKKRSSTA